MNITWPIVDIIFGGQYGSESKRLFNEYYYHLTKPDAIISNFGPNSGGFVSDGGKWAVFAIGADCIHMLSPGSVINIDRFHKEIKRLPKGARVMVHENACVVLPEHLMDEKKLISIGSTMTGTATAMVQKLMRNPDSINTAGKYLSDWAVTNDEWMETILGCERIQLSVPQGHSLSINFGMYPYCTSRNCSPQQALADAGIPFQWVVKVIACMRTFPIRVSNRYDDSGEMIGYSGPCYDDQNEITWEEVGVKPEMTSVSKKVRRVFTFSMHQYVESCVMNGVTDVFMNFMNYLNSNDQADLIKTLYNTDLDARVSWLGYGPNISDIATITPLGINDELDMRKGCHPTIFDIGN